MSNLGGKKVSEDTDKDSAGGQVDSVVAGANVTVDNTDPANPVVASTAAGSPTTTLGDLIKRGASEDERLAIGSALEVLRVNAGGTDLEFATPAASTPTTTEGDIIQRGASADERLAIGTALQVLQVNAGATALEYVTPASGGGTLTTKGDLESFTTSQVRLPVGSNDQVLTADSTAASGLAWKAAAGGTKIISDTTLGSAAQTIGVASLGNLSEFDFELYIPDAVTAVLLAAYINADTSAANYRTQKFQSIDALETSSETNDSVMGVVGVGGPTLFTGKVRMVDGHYHMLVQGIRHKSTTTDSLTHAGIYRELTDTDLDEISFDTNSGTNLLPSGTRLILLNPYV